MPQDSWVYPALDRLAGFGLIDSGFAGMRPWTRRECARLLSEAEDHLADEANGNEMRRELSPSWNASSVRRWRELRTGGGGAFRVESVYSRTGYISGIPIRDGYHFAQTQINDFGRPYGQRLEQHYRLFDVCHERPLGGLFSWRVAELLGFAGITPDGAGNDSASRPPSTDAAGHGPACE